MTSRFEVFVTVLIFCVRDMSSIDRTISGSGADGRVNSGDVDMHGGRHGEERGLV